MCCNYTQYFLYNKVNLLKSMYISTRLITSLGWGWSRKECAYIKNMWSSNTRFISKKDSNYSKHTYRHVTWWGIMWICGKVHLYFGVLAPKTRLEPAPVQHMLYPLFYIIYMCTCSYQLLRNIKPLSLQIHVHKSIPGKDKSKIENWKPVSCLLEHQNLRDSTRLIMTGLELI